MDNVLTENYKFSIEFTDISFNPHSSNTDTHTHTYIHTYGQFSVSNSPMLHVFWIVVESGVLTENHANTGRTCKLYTEMPPGLARTQNEDLFFFAMRQH